MGDGSSRDDRTVYVNNLDSKVTEEILFELFLQAGPLISVKRPKDSEGNVRSFAFVEFEHDVSPPYAVSLMDGICLYGRSIRVQFRSGSRHSQYSPGNSPSATPPYGVCGGQSPVPNGFPSFPTPPAVQRSISAPVGFQGAGLGMPPMPGNMPLLGLLPISQGPRPGIMPLVSSHPFEASYNGPSIQHPKDPNGENGNSPHHRVNSQDHWRAHQNFDDRKPRSHHQDERRHGHSNSSRHDNRYHSDRGHYDDTRRPSSVQRHHSYQHRQERREHPYRR